MPPHIIAKELGPDLMLYDSARDEVHILNGTARLIFELFQEGKSIGDIAQTIRSRYRVEETGDIEADVGRSIDELTSKGLIAPHE